MRNKTLPQLLYAPSAYTLGAAQDDYKKLLKTFAKPFFRLFALDSDAIGQLNSDPQQARKFGEMLGKLGILDHWTAHGQFEKLLPLVDKTALRSVWMDQAFVEAYPDHALTLIQRNYAENGFLRDNKLRSEAAITWYRSLIACIAKQNREDCLKILAPYSSEAEICSWITTYYDAQGGRYVPSELINGLTSVEVLEAQLATLAQIPRQQVARRLFQLAIEKVVSKEGRGREYVASPVYWPLLMTQSEKYPDLFTESTADGAYLFDDELKRYALLWHKVGQAGSRQKLAETILGALDRGEEEKAADAFALAVKWFGENPQPFFDYLDDDSAESYCERYIKNISEQASPLQQLIPRMAAAHLMQSRWFDDPPEPLDPVPICAAMVAYPSGFTRLEGKTKIKLLPLFNEAALVASGEALATLFAMNGKTIFQPALDLVARSSLTALKDAGLFEVAGKKARRIFLIGLAGHREKEVIPYLQGLLQDKAHDDYSRGLTLDALEALGEKITAVDPWQDASLDQLQAEMAKKKVPVAIEKLWNQAWADLLVPLGESLGKHLLNIMKSSEDKHTLPRRARQILAHLSAGRRGDMADLGVGIWVGENGAEKVAWLLQPLAAYGDERAANRLTKAVKDWKKTRKQKASAAMRLLCTIPGTFGIAQAQALWESRQFSDSIMRAGRLALTEAAAKEGLSFEEFLEQLVPDFGLSSQGLTLDVGPYAYTVKIKPDLSLMVVGPTGRVTKSFPKAKADEKADKRSVAENRFKGLRKNLKPVIKQQGQRILRCMQLGKRWSFQRWHQLFIAHPVMAIIAQGVIWGVEGEQGKRLHSFRPTESGDYINLEDDVIDPSLGAALFVLHPVEVTAEERQAWQAHLEDYEISPPFPQWATPVVEPLAGELAQREITRHVGAVIPRGSFGSLMNKWGYLKGCTEDGGRIYEHYWLLENGRWRIDCTHTEMSAWFEEDEEIKMVALIPFKREERDKKRHYVSLPLSDLPIALRATLLAQAQHLLEAGKS